ncbi:retrovirus-related Pol polyprotein from transposon RE2 isoform X2 [Nymphaea colorata]|uniref:retrovirus-related Pol polyprotein from transposon RE2 isoform X2 n=1 Tax=Nymphaea colorata TaxID=210225 RepID=UPI00214F416D|nr:retrovirus-related Pol polyprotein from transposon RE2 isoform X2 [Nymphaea colorata]XP_049936826.1 retrovirus-related Pol polyprotein from transposon RE2 isoform X2 [Nymphaea colorata]
MATGHDRGDGCLGKNDTWEVVDIPKGTHLVGSKWVFNVKYKPDGTVERYKARLVAKGFSQKYGIDYLETFASVAKLKTVRVILALAVQKRWSMDQLDVKNAFLNGHLEEEVYMSMPPGYVQSGKCCHLKKALYGLKQSPRAWFERLRIVMKTNGYKQGNCDHTLFIKQRDGLVSLLLVYVDDMIVTGDDEEEKRKMKERLAAEFDLKDLGKLRYFLGIEIARSETGLVISQRKYTLDLLKETGKLGCRPFLTPMESGTKISIKTGNILDEEGKGRYQRLVGKLIYLTLTRPDITYAVNVLSQFMHAPTDCHWKSAERVLGYLKNNPGKGLLYTQQDQLNIEGYSDADWAGCTDTRRSTTGYCILLGGNLVVWRSKRQEVCSRSSAEAEYRAVAMGVTEMLWLKILLAHIGVETEEKMKMYCDNKSAINLANNPVLHDRTKHVEIDRHFIRERIDSKELILPYMKSEDQIADVLTKALCTSQFEKNVSKLCMFDMYAKLEGSVNISCIGNRVWI